METIEENNELPDDLIGALVIIISCLCFIVGVVIGALIF